MPETPSQDQLEKEHTGRQMDQFQSLLWANDGCAFNPFGFPGYGSPYLRSYQTYRWMLNNPIVRHARSNVISPILASYFQYKKADESVSDARVKLIEKMFDNLRDNHIADWLRGFDYGWAGFELIWDNAAGETRLIETKPLLPERTTIMVNNAGRFTGLQQGGEILDLKVQTETGLIPGLPAPFKAWIYTCDKECGNLYGRSWLENIRQTAWKDWLDAYQQLQKLSAKIAGIQMIMRSPPAQKQECLDGAKGMANGAIGMWIKSFAMNIDPGNNIEALKLLVELTKAGFINIEPMDFGSTVPAIEGLLARIDKAEANIFSGALMSSRTGLEGKHGTKAEAGVHTDTAMLVSELLHDDVVMQGQILADAVLELNFGPVAKGSVILEAPPLVDLKAQRYGEFLTILTGGDSAITRQLWNATDKKVLLEGQDIPILKDAKFEDIEEPVPPVAPPPVNGNGNGLHPRVKQMSNRLGKRLSGN